MTICLEQYAVNDIINGHHSEESRSFGSDPHSDHCIIIHVVIMDCEIY